MRCIDYCYKRVICLKYCLQFNFISGLAHRLHVSSPASRCVTTPIAPASIVSSAITTRRHKVLHSSFFSVGQPGLIVSDKLIVFAVRGSIEICITTSVRLRQLRQISYIGRHQTGHKIITGCLVVTAPASRTGLTSASRWRNRIIPVFGIVQLDCLVYARKLPAHRGKTRPFLNVDVGCN